MWRATTKTFATPAGASRTTEGDTAMGKYSQVFALQFQAGADQVVARRLRRAMEEQLRGATR